MALGEEDGLSQTDLSRRTFLDGATITRALDTLEASGYIERNRDDLDRRVQIVTLTREGRENYLEIGRFGMEVNAEAAVDLSAEERECLETCIRRIIARMNKPDSGEGEGGG